MVEILGNLVPEDDPTHPLGPEPNFDEPVYLDFVDGEPRRGGLLRIGHRANEGYAEVTVVAFAPDGSALFHHEKLEIRTNDRWNAGGLRVEVVRPGEALRTTCDGSLVRLADPRADVTLRDGEGMTEHGLGGERPPGGSRATPPSEPPS